MQPRAGRAGRAGTTRRRHVVGAVALVAALAAVAVPAEAGFITHPVAVDDPPGAPAFAFTPDEINTAYRDGNVHWERGVDGDAEHGIRQVQGLFTKLEPTTGVIDYRVSFSAGTFRYYCPVHGSPRAGMDGVVRVAPTFDPDPASDPAFTVTWGDEEGPPLTGGRFDVRFRRQGANEWTIWHNDTTLAEDEFGTGDEPVRVVEGRIYEFQVRSEKLNNPDKRSGWSPIMVSE